MAPTAGWYDDPRDGDKLRYWDGAAWTEHVTTKQPTSPNATMPVFPGAAEAQQQTWQYGQPTGQQQQQQQAQAPQTQQQMQQQPWAPQQPWPQQQAWPPAPPPPPGGVRTPDGAQVTTWGKRFAARLLDVIYVFLASLPITGYFFYRSYQAVSDQMDSGSYDAFSPSSEVIKWEMIAIGVFMVLGLAYETFCLRRWGATPGKRTLGISVRKWDHGGQLGWSTISLRVGFLYGLAAVSLLPLVGILALIAYLLNFLWPLWDKRRQALQDKVADTVVIEGPRSGPP